MTGSITIAHLSDLHLGPLSGFTPRYWNAKRLIGYYNWRRNRRRLHDPAIAAQLLADIETQSVDHIVITGDLVNIGLPSEHIHALEWLKSVGLPARVSVIPGNHDIYSDLGADPGAMRWQAYMRCDLAGRDVGDAGAFPFVRRLGAIAIIGVNSAIPTAPGIAIGRVGADQMARLTQRLDEMRRQGLFRVVLIHHPPLPGHAKGRHHELVDAAALEQVLVAHGAELVLHGHNHTNTVAWRRTADNKDLPIVGVASASAAHVHRGAPLARYNLYRIAPVDRETIAFAARGLAEPGGPVIALESGVLARSAAAEP